MPRLPDTRFSLLARLAEPADAIAWSEFVEIYEHAIFRYSRSHGLQDADAWEVVQQVLLAVHQKIGEWQPTGQTGSFRCWLLRTAHRICLRSMRDASRCDRAGGEASVDEASHVLPHDLPVEFDNQDQSRDWEQWAFCWAAGFVEQEIGPLTWKAFWMTAVEGIGAAETAKSLGMKIGSVYTAKCRVIARIREQIQSLSRCDL